MSCWPLHLLTVALRSAIGGPSAAPRAPRIGGSAGTADASAVLNPTPLKAGAARSSAKRQRLYRERQKCGLRIVPAPIDPDMIQRLIDLGYLPPDAANDRRAIGEALAEFAEHEAYRGLTVTHNATVAQAIYNLVADEEEEI